MASSRPLHIQLHARQTRVVRARTPALAAHHQGAQDQHGQRRHSRYAQRDHGGAHLVLIALLRRIPPAVQELHQRENQNEKQDPRPDQIQVKIDFFLPSEDDPLHSLLMAGGPHEKGKAGKGEHQAHTGGSDPQGDLFPAPCVAGMELRKFILCPGTAPGGRHTR